MRAHVTMIVACSLLSVWPGKLAGQTAASVPGTQASQPGLSVVLASQEAATKTAEPDKTASIVSVVRALGDVAALTEEEQDVLVEGLYLAYGVDRSRENLAKLRKALGDIRTASKASGKMGQRCQALAAQFGVLDLDDFHRMCDARNNVSMVVRLSYADMLGRVGQFDDAIKILTGEHSTSDFSFLQDRGIRALYGAMRRKGEEDGKAAVSIYRASAECLQMDMAYCEDVIRGIRRLYRHRGLSAEQTANLANIEIGVARSLLRQRDSVAHGAIGYALLKDVRSHLGSPMGLNSAERDKLLAACEEMDSHVETMKKANMAVAHQESTPKFCVRVLTVGEYKAVEMEGK